MKEIHLVTEKTARYFTLGEIHENTRQVWIVCHGYGQLASSFLKKFQSLAQKGIYIVAPEGFHRYYLEGNYGKVGASWMTKEDRLSDIKDYVNFLDKVYDEIKKKVHSDAKITVLGFSQGCATVSRWINYGKAEPSALILYAGVFPPDLDFDFNPEKLYKTSVTVVLGDKDEYITFEKAREQLAVLDQKKISYEFLTFEGKHVIDKNVLEMLCNRLL